MPSGRLAARDRARLPGAVVGARRGQPPLPPLRAAAVQAGWSVERMTSFNSVLLPPAAVVRIAQRRRHSNGEETSDLQLGPEWLNTALETPLRLEARWLGRGRT